MMFRFTVAVFPPESIPYTSRAWIFFDPERLGNLPQYHRDVANCDAGLPLATPNLWIGGHAAVEPHPPILAEAKSAEAIISSTYLRHFISATETPPTSFRIFPGTFKCHPHGPGLGDLHGRFFFPRLKTHLHLTFDGIPLKNEHNTPSTPGSCSRLRLSAALCGSQPPTRLFVGPANAGGSINLLSRESDRGETHIDRNGAIAVPLAATATLPRVAGNRPPAEGRSISSLAQSLPSESPRHIPGQLTWPPAGPADQPAFSRPTRVPSLRPAAPKAMLMNWMRQPWSSLMAPAIGVRPHGGRLSSRTSLSAVYHVRPQVRERTDIVAGSVLTNKRQIRKNLSHG